MQIADIQLANLRRYYLSLIDKAFSDDNSIDIKKDTEWSPVAIMNAENNTFRQIKIHSIYKEEGLLRMGITSAVGTGKCNRSLSSLHIDSLHQLTMWLFRNHYLIGYLTGGALEYKIEYTNYMLKKYTYGPRCYQNKYDAWNNLRHKTNPCEGTLMVKVETGIPFDTNEYGTDEYWLPIRYGNLQEEWIEPDEENLYPKSFNQAWEME